MSQDLNSEMEASDKCDGVDREKPESGVRCNKKKKGDRNRDVGQKETKLVENLGKCCSSSTGFIPFTKGPGFLKGLLTMKYAWLLCGLVVVWGAYLLAPVISQTGNGNDNGNALPEVVTQLDHTLDTWEAPMQIQLGFPYYLSGFDEENRPIWVVEFGKWNMRKYVELGGDYTRNLSRYIDQAFWRLSKSIKLRSTPEFPVTDGIGIFDLANYDLFQIASIPTLQFVMKKARDIEPTTPHMERGFFLNVNYVASTFLNFLKPVLGTFLAKSEIYGTNKRRWIPDLLRNLPKDQLPEWYGGYKNFKPVAVYGRK